MRRPLPTIVDFITGGHLHGLRIALAIDALVTIALGVALHRMYGAIENALDFLIYRRKHEAETYLKRLARTLLRADPDEIDVPQTLCHTAAQAYVRIENRMRRLLRLAEVP